MGAAAHPQTAHYSGAQITLPSDATYPYGVAVDTSGNVWVVDNLSGGVSEVTPSGVAYLAVNGDEVLSGLKGPFGIAVDTHGNLYITQDGIDGPNNVLKETLVPTPFGNSYTQSVLPTSGLSTPYGIAVDAMGNVYIADGSNNRVIKETPSGSSYIQSTLPTSPLSQPEGVAVDAGGAVYIADLGHQRVLKETQSGSGYTESTVVDQLAKNPVGVGVDGRGIVYILAYSGDTAEDYFVVKEIPSAGGYTQSAVPFAPYQNPYGMAVDASGDIFICSPGGNRLEKLVPGAGDFGPVDVGTVNFIIPPASTPISLIFTIDTPGTLGLPAVLTQGATGLDFTDAGSGSCETQGSGHVYAPGEACSIDVRFKPQFSGIRYGGAVLQDGSQQALASAYVYGTGVAPQISFLPARQVSINSGLANPSGVAVDAKGNVFFAESGSGTVYKETRSGNSYALTAIASGLNHPTAVAVDGKGNLYIAATNTVYKETLQAGDYFQSAIITGLFELAGIAVDGSGNLYFTSSSSGDVHKETLHADGSYAETAIGFGISGPAGVAVDGLGNVFVTDPHQGEVYKETLDGNGSYRQSTVASGLAGAESVALDGSGNVYIVAPTSGQIYREALQPDAAYVQSIAAAGLSGPRGIAVDGQGNLYVSVDSTGELAMIDVADSPVLSFPRTQVGSTSADSPQLLTILNIGNSALYFPYLGAGPNPSITTSFSLASTTSCPEIAPSGPGGSLPAGASCVYAIDFIPVAPGSIRGSLGVLDNNLNFYQSPYAKQTIELREGITSDATRTSVRVGPAQIKLGRGVAIVVTVSDTSVAPVIPQGGGVTFTDTVTGKVVALNGGAPVLLVGGKATLNVIPTIAGEHTITAHYGGVNASFAGSTGEALLTVFH